MNSGKTLDRLRGTQQQVIQHERLSALGGMAAGIAHDFNNALSLILGYGELLLLEVGPSPEPATVSEHIGVIIRAAQDAARMFERLRDFQRPAYPGQLVAGLDLNLLVEQAVLLTRPRWRGEAQAAGAHVRVKIRAGVLPPFTGDPAGLRDVLTNLIFNAVDALPKGGTITGARTPRLMVGFAWRFPTTALAWTRKPDGAVSSHFSPRKGKRGRVWAWRWFTAR